MRAAANASFFSSPIASSHPGFSFGIDSALAAMRCATQILSDAARDQRPNSLPQPFTRLVSTPAIFRLFHTVVATVS